MRSTCIECGDYLGETVDDDRVALCESCMMGGTRALGCAIILAIAALIAIIIVVRVNAGP